jgi:hypothetical protein
MPKRRKSAATSAKLAAYRKDKRELAKKLKEISRLEAKARKLELDIVQIRMRMLTRQAPGDCAF